MEINHNAQGRWSVESVQAEYRRLSLVLGGVAGFEPTPRKHTNPIGCTWIYNIMDSVVDGIQLDDSSCVQLAIDYIQDNDMRPSTGYIRERMARALGGVELSSKQKSILAATFIQQIKSQKIYREFREYAKLFKKIGIEPYRASIEKYRKSERQYIVRAAKRLLE